MTQASSIVLGYDPALAGPGFTVNGVASFDLDSAIAFACDLLRHQGAPIPADLNLRAILAAPELLEALRAARAILWSITPDGDEEHRVIGEQIAKINAAISKAGAA